MIVYIQASLAEYLREKAEDEAKKKIAKLEFKKIDKYELNLPELFESGNIVKYEKEITGLIEGLFKDNYQQWKKAFNLEEKLNSDTDKREFYNLKNKYDRLVSNLKQFVKDNEEE